MSVAVWQRFIDVTCQSLAALGSDAVQPWRLHC